MLKFLLYIFLGYIFFRFVTGFLIPVFRTGRQIKQQFNDMQQRMEEQMRQQQAASGHEQRAEKSSPNAPAGEYIDFEEVK